MTLSVTEVLQDSGEEPLEVAEGDLMPDILRAAGQALDNANLCNVVVVKCSDGKYYIGTFEFSFEPISEKEAEKYREDNDKEDENE